MRFLKVIFILSSCVIVSPVYAQMKVLKPIAKGTLIGSEYAVKQAAQMSFDQRLRASGLTYMFPNFYVGKEALRKGVASQVGSKKPTFSSRFKCKAYGWCREVLDPVRLEALVKREVLQKPFPAYFMSFPQAWEKFHTSVGGKLGTLEVVLEAAYGPNTRFDGDFVSSYREVVELSRHRQTDGVMSAALALNRAYNRGMDKKSGFFVIRVQANEDHPQDVLLLNIADVHNVHWISLRQSIGGEWMDTHWIEQE